MRLVSAYHQGRPVAGVLEGDEVSLLASVDELEPQTLADTLQGPRLTPAKRMPIAELKLRPPIPRPGKIICVGLNYTAHVAETGRAPSDYPVLFTKFASALVGARDPIVAPPESHQIDFEGEVAVIIGRQSRRATGRDASDAVGGYCIANDVTVRDYQRKTHQWLQGKSWDRSTPLGPALVTPDEVEGEDLRIRVSVNEELMQDATMSLMIFPVIELIQVVTEFTTLEPGDIILTGTPGGVGFQRDPPRFLKDGDRVVVEVDGLGRLDNVVRNESSQR